MTHKKWRWTLAAVILGGLLLVGVGAGICVYEFGAFSYGGSMVMGETGSIDQELRLSPDCKTVTLSLSGLQQEAHVEVVQDANQKKGTLRFQTRYSAAHGIEMWYELYDIEPGQSIIHLFTAHSGGDLAYFMSVKDQVIQDLKDRTLREYRVIEVQDVQITVNPADMDRLKLEDGMYDSTDFSQTVDIIGSEAPLSAPAAEVA